MKLIKRNYEDGYHDTFWYREQENSQRNRARLAVLLEQRASGHLLEIGCGTGGFLRLAEQHFDVTGIDISHAAVQALRPHFGKRVSALNIEQRPLASGPYHVIVVFNILEHLGHPERVAEKLCAALYPGGLLIGSVPNNFGLVGSMNTRIGNFFDRTHVSTFTPATWKRIFQHAGFAAVDFFGEVTLGRNHCRYLRGRFWPYFSLNLMFLCRKAA